MILKAILCVKLFCSLGATLFIVNLIIKTDSISVLCMFEHVCYEPFSLTLLMVKRFRLTYLAGGGGGGGGATPSLEILTISFLTF